MPLHCALREELELLNHDFHFIFQGHLTFIEDIQIHTDRVPTLSWNSGGKSMLLDHARRRSGRRRECHTTGLPLERVCEHAAWNSKSKHICRNEVGLDDIMCILVLEVAPAADFDVKLTVIWFTADPIPCQQS